MVKSTIAEDSTSEKFDEIENENTTLNSSLCPSSVSQDDTVSEWCKFWIQGIFLSLIGLCGIVGNLVRERITGSEKFGYDFFKSVGSFSTVS